MWALPKNLDQSQYVKNDPRSVYFKVDFITFFKGPVVLVKFWSNFWTVKKLIFLVRVLKTGDFVSVISPWKQSPWSKFCCPTCTSRRGQLNWLKKIKILYPRAKFCHKNRLFEFWYLNYVTKAHQEFLVSHCEQMCLSVALTMGLQLAYK